MPTNWLRVLLISALTGCASYPTSEAEIDACLAEKGSSWSYCTQHYQKQDAAAKARLEWLLRQDPETRVRISCDAGYVVKKIKDINGRECQCMGTRATRKLCRG